MSWQRVKGVQGSRSPSGAYNTYAQCTTQQKGALVGIIRGTVGAQLETLKKRIVEGFDTQAQQTAAGIQGAQVGDIANGTLMDRIDLLAMAIVDPVLHPQFAALVAPVEVSARLDNNAKARKRALYRTLAETVMHRRALYTNTFVDFAVGQFGCVVFASLFFFRHI